MIAFILGAIISFMVFFPTVIAPIIFKIYDERESGKFLRIFFPRYYLFGLILSVIGLFVSLHENEMVSILLFSFLMVTFLFSRQVLTPKINQAKDEMGKNNEKSKKKFDKLHLFSVTINFVQIIMCVLVMSNIFIFQFKI